MQILHSCHYVWNNCGDGSCSNKRDNNFFCFFFTENAINFTRIPVRLMCHAREFLPKIYFLLFVKKLWLKRRFDMFFFSRRGKVILIELQINGTVMELNTISSYTLGKLSVYTQVKREKKTWLQSCYIFELFSLKFSFYVCQNVSYTKIKGIREPKFEPNKFFFENRAVTFFDSLKTSLMQKIREIL